MFCYDLWFGILFMISYLSGKINYSINLVLIFGNIFIIDYEILNWVVNGVGRFWIFLKLRVNNYFFEFVNLRVFLKIMIFGGFIKFYDFISRLFKVYNIKCVNRLFCF